MQTFKVGQIIYVIFKKQAQLIPFRITEEISRKTLQGNSTSYKVECGAQPGQIVDISQIDGEIYSRLEDAQKTMIDRVTRNVEKMVSNAYAKAQEWYGVADEPQQVQQIEGLESEMNNLKNDDKPIIVDLGNGQLARLKG